ncbi:MAG: RagB/SusD family nutrient uptake outer membrane protein [Balneolales bacterium]
MKIFKISTLLLVTTLLAGCDLTDSLEEKPPHLISSETLYTSHSGFQTGLNGLYSLVRQEREGENSSPNQLRFELSITGTDNMVSNREDRFSILSSEWGSRNNSENVHLKSHFEWLYEIVNAANTIINQAEDKDNVDWSGSGFTPEENKNRVIGEARAIRAWAYRHLTYMWGDVPLNLEESLGSTIKTDWSRTPVADVRKQIISDLTFAQQHLPIEPTMRGKISKGAAQHYLAEMYLVEDKPDSALFWANEVINTPEYQLVTDRYGVSQDQPGNPFSDMFQDGNSNRQEGNTEALWVWQWAPGISGRGTAIMRRWHGSEYQQITVGGVTPLQLTVERGGRPQARVSFTKFAMDQYDPEDYRSSDQVIRKYFILKDAEGNAPVPADNLPPGYAYGDTLWLDWSHDITKDIVPVRDWPYSRKFDGTNPDNPGDGRSYQDQVYLRLADTYLLKAEAEHLLSLNGDAASTINHLRRRANVSEVGAGDIDIDFILDERSRELLFEEHRRYTLLRTGKWLERTRMYNMNGGQHITERDKLFPIPQNVIDANLTEEMPQNPLYND